jgi:hypothetical protein
VSGVSCGVHNQSLTTRAVTSVCRGDIECLFALLGFRPRLARPVLLEVALTPAPPVVLAAGITGFLKLPDREVSGLLRGIHCDFGLGVALN